MKKIVLSLATILVVSGVAAGITTAYFSDTETAVGNTFTAGILDLKVGGEDDVLSFKYSGEDLVPGETFNAGTVTLLNDGSIDGSLVLKVVDPVSNENGIYEPEADAGDLVDTEIDTTGYDANEGDGEMWDQLALQFYVDLNKDGQMQWNEPNIYSGPMGVDMTSYYSIPLDENLFPSSQHQGFDDILSGGESVDIGLLVKFFNDEASPMTSQPQYDGMSNNLVMSDDVTFDIVFGLEQVVNP